MSLTNKSSIKANHLFWGGIVFSFSFVLLIWFTGSFLRDFIIGPDLGAGWYYWQLATSKLLSQVIVWIMYFSHQICLWVLIYWANKNLTEEVRTTDNLTKYNWFALIINVFFIFLHWLETQIFYDGLAQDVPIFTSQGSVIIMLAVMLIMENKRRGIFFNRKIGTPITKDVIKFFRFSHMYIFSFAIVYTFWFHPMDNDPQLLTGFLYMFFLFTQATLAYTSIHLNKIWTAFLEGFVAIHALIVAIYNTLLFQSTDMWPMFVLGFLFMVVGTYIYGIGLRRKWIILSYILYILLTIWIYIPSPIGYGRDILYLLRLEMLWIPIVLYGLALLFAFITKIFISKKNTSPS